jgi:hypothetical protein
MHIWLLTFLGFLDKKSEYVVLNGWRKVLEYDATSGAGLKRIEALTRGKEKEENADYIRWIYGDQWNWFVSR